MMGEDRRYFLGELLIRLLAPLIEPGGIGVDFHQLFRRAELQDAEPALPSVGEKLVIGEHLHNRSALRCRGAHALVEVENLLMPKSRPLGFDTKTGVQRIFHPSEDGDSFVEEGRQEISTLLDINTALRNAPAARGDIRPTASIPFVVVEQLMRSGVWYDEEALLKWLADPDNRAFRTRPGRLS